MTSPQKVAFKPPSRLTPRRIPNAATEELSVGHGESHEIFGKLPLWRKMANYGIEFRGV
jgi:hypothetical protein